MILNRIRRLMGWRTEREDCKNITHLIQKQILKRRYAERKQNKLYGSPPKFSRSVIRHINLASKDNKNVLLLKKEKL
jgi:hypothetical protein